MIKNIKKTKLIRYSAYPEQNGSLIPFYTNKSFPKNFKIKRFFILYGKKNFSRADHAHTKCSQIIIPLSGQIKVKVNSRKYQKTFLLNKKLKKALYVPPFNWITIYFKNNDDSLLTLCNYKYDKKEYIINYQKFKNILSK
jgi:dTDP-4-dehydrorhamnose 3,5-epimerase-like enzyme|tara:strand:- start:125 stop:544 length:420 start_codon:yes stop_codon:yes gene_type:complete